MPNYCFTLVTSLKSTEFLGIFSSIKPDKNKRKKTNYFISFSLGMLIQFVCFFGTLKLIWKMNRNVKIETEVLWTDELRAEPVAAEQDQSVVRYRMLDLHIFQPSSRLMPHATRARGSLELHNLSKELAPSQGITFSLQTPNLQTVNFCVLLVLHFSHTSPAYVWNCWAEIDFIRWLAKYLTSIFPFYRFLQCGEVNFAA